MSRASLLALALLAAPAAAGAVDLRLRNAADVALVHVHAVPDGQRGNGPDHLDGQPVAPGEEVRIEVPGDSCRLQLRFVWLDGASAEAVHDACAAETPLEVRAP